LGVFGLPELGLANDLVLGLMLHPIVKLGGAKIPAAQLGHAIGHLDVHRVRLHKMHHFIVRGYFLKPGDDLTIHSL
jgi:hypothetical protein